ncbi:hypothetical protein [Streptomyces sp. BE133]|uniref:hypothetical protein n=1 Tax=Streptomyces sp. BE133 TaxID=3002523 RepID=UPI002E79922E|nr:hypothetical protein [Streptomyces sp. BE133]MEE1807639.1 hypothetical protein [Streptomyces sp. BE133]
MTDIEVLDETGTNATLQHRIDRILTEVVPLVHPTTELELPPLVIYRIVSPQTWQSEQLAQMNQAFTALRARQPWWRKPAVVRREAAARSAFRRTAPLLRDLVMGATLCGPDLLSQTILTPEGLLHSGVSTDEKFLTQVVAHELVHHAQNRASRHGARWAESRSAPPGPAVSVLEEGHARWADRQMTRKLFGTAVDADTARRSDHYLRVAGDPRVADMYAARQIPYTVGCKLVEAAAQGVGIQRLNQVWQNGLLLPNQREMSEPELWATRLKTMT